MSIKIYEAYRFPVDKLNDFLLYCRKQAIHSLKYVIYERLFSYAISTKELEKIQTSTNPEKLATYSIMRAARNDRCELMTWVVEDSCKSVNVWILNGYAYTILYGIRIYDDLPDFAEDYHYQNQANIPEGITEKEYDERLETWKILCLNDWDATRLNYLIFDLSKKSFHYGTQSLLDLVGKELRLWENTSVIKEITESETPDS